MRRKLLILTAGLLMTLAFPSIADAATISYNQGAIVVMGGEGETIEVVSLTGKVVMSGRVDSPAQKFELNIPKGCYIVKVGDTVRKVSVR